VFQVAQAGEQSLAAASITTVQLFATALGAVLAGLVANGAGMNDPGGPTGIASAAAWPFGVFAFAPTLAIVTVLRVIKLYSKGKPQLTGA
jgi:hypothetical protein